MTRTGIALAAAAFVMGSAHAIELDPKAVVYTLPENIKWVVNERAGNAQAVIAGDPSKAGLYVVLTKWLAGNHFSRPHFHPNDRFITVVKGTWWVGSGTNFDTNATVPLGPGTVVTHYGKQVHYDGAKDEDAVLLIVGDGPATSTPFVAGMELPKK
jgi:hypothetical protein